MQRRDGVVALVNPGAAAAAYGDGDVIGTLQKVSNATMDTKGLSVLRTVVVLDKDNQKLALDLLIFNSVVTIAADNAPLTLSDADLESLVCRINIATGDYVTLEANGNACAVKLLESLLPAAAGVKDFWVAVVSRGAPTYTANGLKVKFILERY